MSGRVLIGSDEPWFTGRVTDRAVCVLAPNPSPVTLDGTNTWILAEPDARTVAVIDPGPDDPAHLAAIMRQVRTMGARVVVTLLTHGHPDHAEGAREFRELSGAPVLALDPRHCLGSEGLIGGEVIVAGGMEIHVVATPGHTSDCLSFHLPVDGSLLTGDTVLGRGTTVVAWPDGDLGAYLRSLDDLSRLTETGSAILPGHGPMLPDAHRVITDYVAHRHERLQQVRSALAAGATTAEQVVDLVYADIPPAVRPAATLSARAQVEYLRAGG